MADVEIPLEAYGLAHHVYKRDAQLDADALDMALEAAAALIAAAELEARAGELNCRDDYELLMGRVRELRGEGLANDGH